MCLTKKKKSVDLTAHRIGNLDKKRSGLLDILSASRKNNESYKYMFLGVAVNWGQLCQFFAFSLRWNFKNTHIPANIFFRIFLKSPTTTIVYMTCRHFYHFTTIVIINKAGT